MLFVICYSRVWLMYKKYYNLHRNPFQMTPDPSIFFASTGHKRALSYLQYGLSQGEGFIVITGDIGTGKTTIVKNLIAGLDQRTYIAKELVTTQLKELDLIEMICESFELISEGLSKAALLNQFKAFLSSANKLGRRVVLVVDEVQNLPIKTIEELRMLSNFQSNNKPLIQSFLVGQKEFVDILQTKELEQLRQRVIASCHLGPLSSDETKFYINYRLAEAGWQGNQLFDDQAMQIIHELTDGVPRRINVFCDRILLFGYLEEVTYFTKEHINIVSDELADEIISPINSEKHERIDEYINTLQDTYNEKSGSTSTTLNDQVVDEINHIDLGSLEQSAKKVFSQTVQSPTKKNIQRSKTSSKQANRSLSSDFMDIDEAIRDFDFRVEQEILAYQESLRSNVN